MTAAYRAKLAERQQYLDEQKRKWVALLLPAVSVAGCTCAGWAAAYECMHDYLDVRSSAEPLMWLCQPLIRPALLSTLRSPPRPAPSLHPP